MTAKLMMEKDGYVGFRTRTDSNNSNLKRIDAGKNTPEQEVKDGKNSLYVHAVTMEQFIEQRKNEYIFL